MFHNGDGRILRGLTEDGAVDYRAVAATPFLPDAEASGDLIASREVTADLPGQFALALEHPRLPVVSYPYEWSFSMLQDAARLQLRLLRDGLARGVMCKDASAYNVQFMGARPLFIDVGSFEPWREGEPWPGYRQFCQLFLYPLMLQAHLGVPFQPLLRGSIDGIPPATAAAMLRGRARWHRGVLSHVWLHARAENRYATDDHKVVDELRRAGVPAAVVRALAARLARTIEGLAAVSRETAWSDYGPRRHYPGRALEAKDGFVIDVLSRRRWPVVLDLGANDGHYAVLAASHADHVVTTDVDEVVVDDLYRALRAGGPDNVTPLVVDLADPSPALGWRGRERPAIDDRVRPDLILCLALLHHLVVGRGIPLAEVVAHLASFGTPVVIEVPHADDPMVQRVAGARRDALVGYDIQTFESLAVRHFTIVRKATLPGACRTMFELVPR